MTCIYETGPQTLTDTIWEVEKLNAAQQLTAMIIPPSTFNVISNEEHCCFQCQEPGHTGLTLGVMNATNMVTFSWTVYTEYHLQELQWHTTNCTNITTPDQIWGTTVKVETGIADPDHSHTFKDIITWAITICIEATLDHNTKG